MTAFPTAAATDYDRRITRLVPGYELALRLIASELSARLPAGGRVLVPGCGIGNDLIAVAERCPRMHLHGVEPSAAMLTEARRKLAVANLAARVVVQHGEVGGAPGGPFDAAAISLVLHFLSDEAKQELLTEVAQRLRPGSPLLLVDTEPLDTTAWWRRDLSRWLDQQGHTEHQRSAVLARMDSWRPASPQWREQLCAAAGFEAPRELLRMLCYSVSLWQRRTTTGSGAGAAPPTAAPAH